MGGIVLRGLLAVIGLKRAHVRWTAGFVLAERLVFIVMAANQWVVHKISKENLNQSVYNFIPIC
jgi:hypothetical protein